MKNRNNFLAIVLGIFATGTLFSQEAAVVQQVVEPVVKIVPNYSKNLEIFIALGILTAVLLLAIVLMAYSIKTMLASDYYRNRILEKRKEEEEIETKSSNNNSTFLSVGILGLFLLSQSNAMAFSFKIEDGDQPWLRIENTDLYLILVLNLILVGVLIYLKRMFNQLVENVRLEKEKKVAVPVAKPLGKLNKVLTSSVPLEHEDKILMDHDFDGIQELDNNLPPWWIALFFISIIFSIGYMAHYHVFKTGDLQIKEYTKSMQKADEEVQAYLSKMAMNVDETNATVMTEDSDISAGKSIFINNCAVCHLEKGEGNIGPNLTDEYWITAGDIKTIFQTVKYGTAMGMPEHASKLNPIQIQQVSSFIYQLPFTPGKEAEGEKYTEEEVE